jgi:hypothetical protein
MKYGTHVWLADRRCEIGSSVTDVTSCAKEFAVLTDTEVDKPHLKVHGVRAKPWTTRTFRQLLLL